MKVGRRRGVVRLTLSYDEAEVLAEQLNALATALTDEAGLEPPVRQRLFPDALRDDPAAAAEFRALTEQALRETKQERIGQCRAEIPPGGGEIQLDSEGVDRWLTVTNDLRLTLGTRLDVREDDDVRLDPDDPQLHLRVVYYWLTELQDNLVHAAMA